MSKYTAPSDFDYREASGDYPDDAPCCSECDSPDCQHATDDAAYCEHDPLYVDREADCPQVPR